ncbi:2106_t:CDS:1, partial [Diversispora eburnea]
MSLRKKMFISALESGFIKGFDYSSFENITIISGGGYGTVYCSYSTNLEKYVALKSLHEKDESFYENFVRE